MITRAVRPGVFSVGAIDWDRRLFDELIPLPFGTSYNSYLVQGSEKTALIDTVYPAKRHEYMANLKASGVDRLDYLISSHAEPDHSGAIPAVLEAHPQARVVTNAKCKALLLDALPIAADRIVEVKDGDTLALGGRTLEFLLTPWVHWPDTMCTRLVEDGILFTCDFMGSHLATSDLFARDEARVLEAAKRYYAEIMAPFRAQIQKHLERIGRLDLTMIAPSHGPIHARPELVLDAYRRWASDTPGGTVVIPHVSMYESTARMVACLTDRLVEKGLSVQPHNAVGGDLGEFATALVDASVVVFASPTVLGGPHPSIASLAYLANALRPKARLAAVIGSYGWGGKVAETLQSMLAATRMEFLDPVLVKGLPREKDREALARLAERIGERCRALAAEESAA